MGTVVGVHGVDGEMKVRPHTDDVEQFDTFRYCYFGAEEKPRRVQSARHHGGHVLIRVHGVGDREAALLFRGFDVRVDTAQLTPLDEGEFFLYQVIGLEVLDETGSRVGTLVDLIETGSADVFVINPGAGGQHILLANQPEVVLDISPADGQIRVRLPRYLE